MNPDDFARDVVEKIVNGSGARCLKSLDFGSLQLTSNALVFLSRLLQESELQSLALDWNHIQVAARPYLRWCTVCWRCDRNHDRLVMHRKSCLVLHACERWTACGVHRKATLESAHNGKWKNPPEKFGQILLKSQGSPDVVRLQRHVCCMAA